MIATALLPHRVKIEPRTGTTGQGAPAFGDPLEDVPARVDGKRRAVRTSTGVDVIANATCTIRPGPAVPPGSRVTHGEALYDVLEAITAVELRRDHHVDLLLDGPRPAPAAPPDDEEPEPEPEP